MLVTAQTDVPSTSRTKRTHYQVVHRNTRRIRLLVPQLAKDTAYASWLKSLAEGLDCVTNVRINPAASSIAIEYDYQASEEAIAKSQTVVFEAIDQTACTELELTPRSAPQETHEINYWQRLGLPAIGLGAAMFASPLDLPFLLVGGLIAGAALPIFNRAITGISEERKIKVDVLDSLWITLQALQGQYVAPALMISLLECSEFVRDVTARANEDETLKLLDLSDRQVWVERDGQQQRLPLQDVQKGDRIIVYPGELIPVDGRILYGTGLIDEHKVNGKTTLVAYSEGQKVYASTLVVKGKLCVIAERTGSDTRAALVAQFLKAAPVADTQAGDKVKDVSDTLVVPTLLLSGSLFAMTGNISGALAPLQLDFGTGIGIAVPTTILAALTDAARAGIFIRNGRALESLARVDTVVFGKTGTLTEAIVTVVGIQTIDESISITELLTLASSAEQQLDHPVARAIVRYGSEKGIQARKCKAWDYQVGMGVSTRINNQKILVGSDRYLEEQGVDLAPIYRQHPHLKMDNHSLVYVARNSELMGVILLDNPLRKESASVIDALKAQGIETHLLTSDTQQSVQVIATQLGVEAENTDAQVFPKQKIEIIRRLHNAGKTVAYVADELSDTEALAYADVSISFAKGTDLEGETADIVLLDNDLKGVIHAIAIAKQAMEIVYQNIAIVAVPNISVVLAGLFLGLDPIAAVIINNCAALIAEMNGRRLLFNTESE